MKTIYSKEVLVHYRCNVCQQWWTIGDDDPEEREYIYCPNCGSLNSTEEAKPLDE